MYPLKKIIRENQGPFMTNCLNKEIMTRSKLQNRYLKWPSRENFLDYKGAKSTCNNLKIFRKRYYFVSSKRFVCNMAFWNTVKPCLTSKGFLTNKNIVVKHENELCEW